MQTRGVVASLVVLVAVGFVAPGCERTPADVERWRNAKRGVEKMTGWAQSSEEPIDVRQKSLELLVRDHHVSQLADILKNVESGPKKKLVARGTATVQEMWKSGEVPKLKEGQSGNIKQKDSWQSAIRAKDAAYYLQPHAKGEEKKKLESLLTDWVSRDWALRKKLGKISLDQAYARAGEGATEPMLKWLEETGDPYEPAEIIRKKGSESARKKAAKKLRKLAEEKHPNLSKSLLSAVVRCEQEEIVPYLKMAVQDDKSPPRLIDQAMEAIKRIEGPTATPFFSKLIEERSGNLRWAAVNELIAVRGESGVMTAATALPLDRGAYKDEDGQFRKDASWFANFVAGEIENNEDGNWSDTLTSMLESERWPVQTLGLMTVKVASDKDLLGDDKATILEAVKTLTSKRSDLPNWGENKRVGQLAHEVANKLEA